jgi:hypothetical protein
MGFLYIQTVYERMYKYSPYDNLDIKWIPIEPISPTETSRPDTNRSKLPHADTLIERVKILQRLMDKGSKNDGDTENKKGWYVLDTMEND